MQNLPQQAECVHDGFRSFLVHKPDLGTVFAAGNTQMDSEGYESDEDDEEWNRIIDATEQNEVGEWKQP